MKNQDEYTDMLLYIIVKLEDYSIDIKCISNILADSEQILICGNGGSSATASHFTNDLQKMCGLKALCLTDNTPLITAISNDESYDNIFVNQLETLCSDNRNEAIVIFSGSGNSENIVRAAKWGIDNDKYVIAFIGQDGGRVKDIEKVILVHIESDMQHAEDWHLIVSHIITRLIHE